MYIPSRYREENSSELAAFMKRNSFAAIVSVSDGQPVATHLPLSVTRDGTDNGDETPLHTRIERVRHALDKKQAVIVFDVESQQCQLCLKRDVPKEWLADLEMLSAQDSAE